MRLPFDEVKEGMKGKLIAHGCEEKKADKVAHEVARNSLEGTYTCLLYTSASDVDRGIRRDYAAETDVLNHQQWCGQP